ncbi:MAG: hypothetical protein WC608_01550 [Parcubacteria group bacterium]
MEKKKKEGFTTRTINLNDPKYDRKLRDDDPEWIKKMARGLEKLGLRYWVEREKSPATLGILLSGPNFSLHAFFKFATFKCPDFIKKEIEKAKKEGFFLTAICKENKSVKIRASMEDPSMSIKDIVEQRDRDAEKGFCGICLLCPNRECEEMLIYVGWIAEDNKCPKCGQLFDAKEVAKAKRAESENEELRKKAGVENPFLARV